MIPQDLINDLLQKIDSTSNRVGNSVFNRKMSLKFNH